MLCQRRNFASYGAHLDLPEGFKRDLLCDPQTSGGLLVSVDPCSADEVSNVLNEAGLPSNVIGQIVEARTPLITI